MDFKTKKSPVKKLPSSFQSGQFHYLIVIAVHCVEINNSATVRIDAIKILF